MESKWNDGLYLNQYNLFETVGWLTVDEVKELDDYAKKIILIREEKRLKVKNIIKK